MSNKSFSKKKKNLSNKVINFWLLFFLGWKKLTFVVELYMQITSNIVVKIVIVISLVNRYFRVFINELLLKIFNITSMGNINTVKKSRIIIQPQTILLHFYKLLLWPTSYWFSSSPSNNIIIFIYQQSLTTLTVCKKFL